MSLYVGDFWGMIQLIALMALVWSVVGGGEHHDPYGRGVLERTDERPGRDGRR